MTVSLSAAFLAGLVSFLSPCVLPLVPPYLCFLAGASLEDLTARENARPVASVAGPAIAFVLGFSTVFVILGATASVLGQLLRDHLTTLSTIAGVVIILMGLHFLGVFRFALLNRDTRYAHASRPAGLLGAYVIGLAFAFGWTPCIGPVLAVILSLAATEESVTSGAFLLAVYSAGLAVPFLAASFGIERFLGFLKRFRAHLGLVERGMGVALILTGVLFLTGGLQSMSYWLLETFPALGRLG
ncbi:MAG: cytochrome c biogenesis CcdA family protein [Parvibaculaceae bacterium]